MNRVLITYVSHSGSTQEVARFMGSELSAQGLDVDVRSVSEVADLSPYDFIVAGGLVYRFGWHPDIVRFLKENLAALKGKNVALFVVGMRLVKTPDCDQASFPIFIDPAIMKSPKDVQRKDLTDSLTTMKWYLQATLPTIEKIKPVSLAFFAGKLDLRTLPFSEKLIMILLMLLVGKKPADYRNWEAIRNWVKGLNIAESFVDQLDAIPTRV